MLKIKYRSLKKYKYQLLEDYFHSCGCRYRYHLPFLTLDQHGILIKKGYCWDGPSGPTIDTKDFIFASLVHDVYYQLIRDGYFPASYKLDADNALRDIMLSFIKKDDGRLVKTWKTFRANYIYFAVKIFGRFSL